MEYQREPEKDEIAQYILGVLKDSMHSLPVAKVREESSEELDNIDKKVKKKNKEKKVKQGKGKSENTEPKPPVPPHPLPQPPPPPPPPPPPHWYGPYGYPAQDPWAPYQYQDYGDEGANFGEYEQYPEETYPDQNIFEDYPIEEDEGHEWIEGEIDPGDFDYLPEFNLLGGDEPEDLTYIGGLDVPQKVEEDDDGDKKKKKKK